MSIHVLSRAVIISEHQILLAYDPRAVPFHYYELNKLFYYLPGGHIHHKETSREAVLREIHEETNHHGKIIDLLGVVENFWSFPGDEVCCHTHEVNFIYNVSIPHLNPCIALAQKEVHVAFKWFSLYNLKEIDLRPSQVKNLILKNL